MKLSWLVLPGTTAVLASLMMGPVGAQSSSQSVTIISSGPGQRSEIRTVSSSQSSIVRSLNDQQAHVQISAARLGQAHRLTVQSSAHVLSGEIKLDGRTIYRLDGATNTVDLSPHLSTGEHTLEITGTYAPRQASVQIALVGPGATVSHQMSGQGQLANTIRLTVR